MITGDLKLISYCINFVKIVISIIILCVKLMFALRLQEIMEMSMIDPVIPTIKYLYAINTQLLLSHINFTHTHAHMQTDKYSISQ